MLRRPKSGAKSGSSHDSRATATRPGSRVGMKRTRPANCALRAWRTANQQAAPIMVRKKSGAGGVKAARTRGQKSVKSFSQRKACISRKKARSPAEKLAACPSEGERKIQTGTRKATRHSARFSRCPARPVPCGLRKKKALKNMAPQLSALTPCTHMAQPQAKRATGLSHARPSAESASQKSSGKMAAKKTRGTGSAWVTPQKVPQPTQMVMPEHMESKAARQGEPKRCRPRAYQKQ